MGFNGSTAAVGGVYGAETGYNIGSNFGPWGAGIGAAVGLIGGALGGGFGFGGDPGMASPGPLANMSDAEYNWYKQNIIPLQQQAYNSAFNPQQIQQQLGNAKAGADQTSANANAAFSRQMAGAGIVLTPAQKANAQKQAALNKGISEATALNTTRASIGQQQAGILGTG
jgi:hypothetical protein